MSTTDQGASHYDLLNVAPDASTQDIKKAYRALARRLHPDHAGPGMESLFNQVTRAYEVLSDPERRAEYDASQAGPPAPEPEPEPWGTEEVIIDEPDPPATDPTDDGPLPPPPPPPIPPLPPMSEQAARRAHHLKVLAWLSIPVLLTYNFAIPWVVAAFSGHLYYMQQTAVTGWIVMLGIPMLLRIFGQRGKISLGIMIAITALLLLMGEIPGVGAALLCIATAELWRRQRQSKTRRGLAAEWHQFRAWAGGRELLVLSLAPQGQRALLLVQDPYTLDRHQIMVWGAVRPGMWVVLDDARAILGTCPDEARVAWEALYA